MAYLKNIKFSQCFNFKNCVEMNLNDITLLCGPNGSGKTNIQRVIYNLANNKKKVPEYSELLFELNEKDPYYIYDLHSILYFLIKKNNYNLSIPSNIYLYLFYITELYMQIDYSKNTYDVLKTREKCDIFMKNIILCNKNNIKYINDFKVIKIIQKGKNCDIDFPNKEFHISNIEHLNKITNNNYNNIDDSSFIQQHIMHIENIVSKNKNHNSKKCIVPITHSNETNNIPIILSTIDKKIDDVSTNIPTKMLVNSTKDSTNNTKDVDYTNNTNDIKKNSIFINIFYIVNIIILFITQIINLINVYKLYIKYQSIDDDIMQNKITCENVTPSNIIPENIISENVTPSNIILENIISENVTPSNIILENITSENLTPENKVINSKFNNINKQKLIEYTQQINNYLGDNITKTIYQKLLHNIIYITQDRGINYLYKNMDFKQNFITGINSNNGNIERVVNIFCINNCTNIDRDRYTIIQMYQMLDLMYKNYSEFYYKLTDFVNEMYKIKMHYNGIGKIIYRNTNNKKVKPPGSLYNILTILIPIYYCSYKNNKCSIILLDEPEIGLDSYAIKKLYEHIESITNINSFATKIIISTHNQNFLLGRIFYYISDCNLRTISNEYKSIFHIILPIFFRNSKKTIISEGISDVYYVNLLIPGHSFFIKHIEGKENLPSVINCLNNMREDKNNIFLLFDRDTNKKHKISHNDILIKMEEIMNINNVDNDLIGKIKNELGYFMDPVSKCNLETEKDKQKGNTNNTNNTNNKILNCRYKSYGFYQDLEHFIFNAKNKIEKNDFEYILKLQNIQFGEKDIEKIPILQQVHTKISKGVKTYTKTVLQEMSNSAHFDINDINKLKGNFMEKIKVYYQEKSPCLVKDIKYNYYYHVCLKSIVYLYQLPDMIKTLKEKYEIAREKILHNKKQLLEPINIKKYIDSQKENQSVIEEDEICINKIKDQIIDELNSLEIKYKTDLKEFQDDDLLSKLYSFMSS